MKKNYSCFGAASKKIGGLIIAILISLTGAKAQTYATIPFYTGFESGNIGPSWTTSSSLAGGEIAIFQTGILTWSTQTALSNSGNYFLGMHYPTGGAYNMNQANLHLDLAGESNVRLDFYWAEWNDETEPEDGIYISSNGGTTFTKVLDLNGANYTDLEYTHFDMSLDSINTLYGMSFTSNYIIRFQQYDNYYFAGGNDGFLFDDITVATPCPFSTASLSPVVCSSYTVPSGNATYTTSGTYTDTLVNAVGCDSLITINLQVNETFSTLSPTVCNTYTAPDGATYTSSGTYTAVIPNSNSCDSTITINLTVNQPTSSTITESACESYLSPDGNTYTTSGTYTAVIPNSNSCDSTITINLTVNQPTSSTIAESACESYLSPAGNTYTTSGTFTETIQNTAGCDSTITINLTVNQSTSSTLNETALDSYTSPSGNIYTTSGIYMDTIQNSAGCDSIITINLIVEYAGLTEFTNAELSLSPNPGVDYIALKGTKISAVQRLRFIDAKGKEVMVTKQTDKIDVSSLTPGLYQVIVELENRSHLMRFVKQ